MSKAARTNQYISDLCNFKSLKESEIHIPESAISHVIRVNKILTGRDIRLYERQPTVPDYKFLSVRYYECKITAFDTLYRTKDEFYSRTLWRSQKAAGRTPDASVDLKLRINGNFRTFEEHGVDQRYFVIDDYSEFWVYDSEINELYHYTRVTDRKGKEDYEN